MFSLEATFDETKVNAYIDRETKKWFDKLLGIYREQGREFAERARTKMKPLPDAFGNITWNLRSSIGFFLTNNNEVIESYFPVLQTGAEGSEEGDKYAREIAANLNHTEGIALVLVAGMDYAKFVKTKGFDVIESSTDVFEIQIKKLLFAA